LIERKSVPVDRRTISLCVRTLWRKSMKILLAVDNSKFARRSARFVAEHFSPGPGSADVTVLNAHPRLPYTARATAVLGRQAIESYYREECEASLASASKELAKRKVPHERVWRIGDPATVILEFARKGKVDLIVMGSRGRTDLARLVMGSVSSKVLAASKIPVLLVP
jgi:nucleotide-binding universal stress UspA family protein